VAVISTADALKADVEVKLLLGCTDEEMEIVRRFHDESDDMSGLLIARNGPRA
jgi:inorganic pyrophosphatase